MNKSLLTILIFALTTQLFGQNSEEIISGKVSDEKGDPIPGVNIFIKNTSTGTISEFDGTYQLAIPSESQFVVFSYIGYLTVEEPINNRSIIDVILIEDTQQLEEIIEKKKKKWQNRS